jgi:hypothetical protein
MGFLLAFLLCVPPHATLGGSSTNTDAQPSPDAQMSRPAFRHVSVLVTDEHGSPVEGARVSLFGIERYSRNPDGEEGKEFATDYVWDFLTSQDGTFSAWFGKLNEAGYLSRTGESRPGYGEFYFLASKPGYAGGVSRRIENWAQDESDMDWIEDEWYSSQRPALRIKDNSVNAVKIVLCRGLTLRGRVIDAAGKPVKGVNISVADDLHVDTHTGYGGSIFGQNVVTDNDGMFQIHRIYPNRFYLNVEETGLHWARTCIGKKWSSVPLDTIDPPATASELPITIVLTATPPFRHAGKVTDNRGNGIAHLRVVMGLSWHWPPSTYADEHHVEQAETGADGTVEILSDAPYAWCVSLDSLGKKQPYETVHDVDAEERDGHPLGDFHLVVKPHPL